MKSKYIFNVNIYVPSYDTLQCNILCDNKMYNTTIYYKVYIIYYIWFYLIKYTILNQFE